MTNSAAHARFLRMLLEAVGAGTACTISLLSSGCGGDVNVPPGGTDATGATGTGGSSATSTGTGTGSGSGSSSSSGGNIDAGMVDCKPLLVSSTQTLPPEACKLDGGVYGANYNCFAAPTPPATCADSFSDECVLSTYSCGFSNVGTLIECGPLPGDAGACCYVITGDCPVGRPFTVDGEARLGVLVPGEGWRDLLAPDQTGLDAESRAALADAWGREALFEHASIASFARFVLELLAVGAPADLVHAAQRALAEEQAHARACLGLVSAYAGEALQPSALSIAGALASSMDAAEIAASLAREGCVAETIAALQVARAHEEARDPVVKGVLARIARDEAEHAALSWRALRWMLDAGSPAVRNAVAKVFAEADAHVSLGAITDLPGDAEQMRAHGYSPVEERRALAREALGRVVGPAATALLAMPPHDQRARRPDLSITA